METGVLIFQLSTVLKLHASLGSSGPSKDGMKKNLAGPSSCDPGQAGEFTFASKCVKSFPPRHALSIVRSTGTKTLNLTRIFCCK